MDLTYTRNELEVMLMKMEEASSIFYSLAQRTKVHQFLEVNGFLQELIKAYKRMQEKGKDFATEPLEMEPYEMAYIAEKLDCIFGEALSVPKNRDAFLEALASKGGWKWQPKSK